MGVLKVEVVRVKILQRIEFINFSLSLWLIFVFLSLRSEICLFVFFIIKVCYYVQWLQ